MTVETTTQQRNTKVELTVEAFEDLANAIFDGRMTERNDKTAVDKITDEILEKRTALKAALHGLTAAHLRVINGGLYRQPYTADTEEADKPLCETCLRKKPCLAYGPNCQHWAAAVRRKHNENFTGTPGDVG